MNIFSVGPSFQTALLLMDAVIIILYLLIYCLINTAAIVTVYVELKGHLQILASP